MQRLTRRVTPCRGAAAALLLAALLLPALLLPALLLNGCTVGPNYKGPPAVIPPQSGAFLRAPEAGAIEGPVQPQWWLSLGDPILNGLEATTLARNPDLDEATARLLQSRRQLREQRADLLPTTSASATYLHSHTQGNLLGGIAGGSSDSSGGSSEFSLYNLGFDASWEIDLFGGQRRAVQAAAAAAGAREAQLAGVRLSLTAEVAQAYVALRDLQIRSAIARDSADLQGRTLGLTKLRLAGGTASVLDVARLTTQVDTTQTALLPLRAQIEAELDRLAMLTGAIPGTLDAPLTPAAPLPLPPQTVTVGDPASLLRRRPDIMQAERDLAGQNALIGEHIADYFPKVSVLGDIGFTSTDISDLLSPNGFFAVAAPMLKWQPWEFGRISAQVGQARAARDATAAHYRSVVLGALDDAEDALSRFGIQRGVVLGDIQVRRSAEKAAALTRQRYAGGTATLIDTLDTERTRLDAEQALASDQAELTQDFISLQKSLGLGWSSQ